MAIQVVWGYLSWLHEYPDILWKDIDYLVFWSCHCPIELADDEIEPVAKEKEEPKAGFKS